MGHFKCTILFKICTISFLSYYDIGCTMVCLHNMFMVLLIFALGNIKVGATKPISLDSVSPRGRGVCACMGMVCYHCIVHTLNSSKKTIFFVSNSDLCRAMLPNYLRTYSSALCQTRALEKPFRSKNMAKVYPNFWF